MSDAVLIGFDFDQQSLGLEFFDHSVTALEPVQSFELAGFVGHVAVVADYLHTFQIVAGADFKVIGIVGRGYFQSPGAE